jgi:hypothetical protein
MARDFACASAHAGQRTARLSPLPLAGEGRVRARGFTLPKAPSSAFGTFSREAGEGNREIRNPDRRRG